MPMMQKSTLVRLLAIQEKPSLPAHPKASAICFIKQFARAYNVIPGIAQEMGIIAN
jgi:hypothetical protein